MSSKLLLLAITPILLLGACKQSVETDNSPPAGRYQIVHAPRHEGEPWIFRVDTTSGKTWVLDTLSTNGLNWLLIPGSEETKKN